MARRFVRSAELELIVALREHWHLVDDGRDARDVLSRGDVTSKSCDGEHVLCVNLLALVPQVLLWVADGLGTFAWCS